MSAKKKAAPVEAQPLELAIVVEGKIIESNFPAFREDAEKHIEAINFSLITDEDFDRAAADTKGLKRFEDVLAERKADFLRQMDDVNALLESVDGLAALARKTRLELSKIVDRRNVEIREGIVRDGIAALDLRCREFCDRISAGIKGKKSMAKMQEAVTDVVDDINAGIAANRQLMEAARAEHGEGIAYSESAFLTMAPEAAKVEMERRIERYRAALKEAAQQAEIERMRKEAWDSAKKARAAEAACQPKPEPVAQSAPAPIPAVEQGPAPVTQPTSAPAPADPTQREEADAFMETLMKAFAPAKELRSSLRHPANKAAAEKFATALVLAWKELLTDLAPR